MQGITEDFEWASSVLLTLCGGNAIHLIRKHHYDTLSVPRRNNPGGADILAKIGDRLAVVDCTTGPLTDNIEKLVNVLKEFEQINSPNAIQLLPIIITSKFVSDGELKKANGSGIVVLNQESLRKLLDGMKDGRSEQILNSIIREQLNENIQQVSVA